jgi:hypothetical protein
MYVCMYVYISVYMYINTCAVVYSYHGHKYFTVQVIVLI